MQFELSRVRAIEKALYSIKICFLDIKQYCSPINTGAKSSLIHSILELLGL